MKDKVYTVQELANHLKVCTRTIYNCIHFSQLKATQVGRQYRISHSDFEDYRKEYSSKI